MIFEKKTDKLDSFFGKDSNFKGEVNVQGTLGVDSRELDADHLILSESDVVNREGSKRKGSFSEAPLTEARNGSRRSDCAHSCAPTGLFFHRRPISFRNPKKSHGPHFWTKKPGVTVPILCPRQKN